MHDTSIYEKYFCKGSITNKDVAGYISQWLPDFRRFSPSGNASEGSARSDVAAGIEDNKRVAAKLNNNEPLDSDDIKDILVYLESAQRSMHRLLPDAKVTVLDKFIDNLRNKSGKL